MIKVLTDFYKKQRLTFFVVVTTFVLIISLAIIFRLRWFDVIPLCVSLIIMALQSSVNRYAFLLGAINSLLYAAVYFMDTLYGSFLYSVLISSPLQAITFINWNRKTVGNVTEIRKMKWWVRVVLLLFMVAVWVALYLLLSAFGSEYLVLDNTVTILGVVATVLSMLRFMEYTALQLVSQGVSIALYCTMLLAQPGKITYVVFSVYTLYCVIRGIININKQIKNQKQYALEVNND